MSGKGVTAELEYAAPKLERLLERPGRGDMYAVRRRVVAERALGKV